MSLARPTEMARVRVRCRPNTSLARPTDGGERSAGEPTRNDAETPRDVRNVTRRIAAHNRGCDTPVTRHLPLIVSAMLCGTGS